MKKILLALFACCLLAVVCCQDESGIEKEKKAIIAVIEAEKVAYYNKDLSVLDASWVQDPYSRKMFLTTHGVTELNGWDEIHQNNIEAVERDWSEHVETVQYSDYSINIYGNTALVLHDSEHQITDHDVESILNMRRILHLVKVDDEWKIDLMAMYFMPHIPLGEEIEM
jgi:ketosteroid isomerase-like protein